jgi:cAMP-dependent protein kinase regulator
MTQDEHAQAVSLLERLPLFGGCTHKEIERLALASQPIAFHAGDKICVAGDESPECYVVANGRAEVTVGNVTVGEVGPVDVVGERGPITNRPRAANVTARTHMLAYAISRQQIKELMFTSPTAAATMRDELLRRYG